MRVPGRTAWSRVLLCDHRGARGGEIVSGAERVSVSALPGRDRHVEPSRGIRNVREERDVEPAERLALRHPAKQLVRLRPVAALGRLARQPFASLMTILVIAVTLALPAALHLVIKNAQSISGGWANALDFSVYLDEGTSVEAARDLAALESWDAGATERTVRAFAERRETKLANVAQPLRAALTGRTTSPPIFDVLAVLGRDESLARLRDQAHPPKGP